MKETTEATRNGVTVLIMESTHDDFSRSWRVEARNARTPDRCNPSRIDRMNCGTFASEAEARSCANRVFHMTGERYVQDDYGNPALVTAESETRLHITQLTGSDRGRRTTAPADRPSVPVNAWIARTAADL